MWNVGGKSIGVGDRGREDGGGKGKQGEEAWER